MPTDPTDNASAGQDGGDAAAADTRDGLLGLSEDDLLIAGLTPSADGAGAAGDEGDASAAGAAGQAPATAQAPAAQTGQAQAAPTSQVPPAEAKFAEYVTMLAVDPGRATEVPEKVRAEAQTAAAAIRDQVERQTAQALLDRLEQANRTNAATLERIGTFLELREAGDEDALQAEEERDPAGAELYHQHMAALAGSRKPAQTLPVEVVALKARATEIFGQLPSDEAKQRISAAYQSGKYPTTEAGLEALRTDVRAEVERAQAPGRTPQARVVAAQARANLARPEASPGSPVDGRTSRKELLAADAGDLLKDALSA